MRPIGSRTGLRSSMSWTRRLPAGDLVVDLRPANPPDVVVGTVFSEVAQDLAALEVAPRVRVWVLHDAAVEWCTDAEHLERGLRAWLGAAAHGAPAPGGHDVVVLPPAAALSAELVAALQALGLSVHPVRRGGGLPMDVVELDGIRTTAISTRALPPGRLPARLGPAIDRIRG